MELMKSLIQLTFDIQSNNSKVMAKKSTLR